MSFLKDLSNLSGRTSLITGAAGGLGQIFSETLAELGSNLILVDLPNLEHKCDVKKFSEKFGINALFHPCDLEIREQRLDLITMMLNSKSELSVLVNNAALVGNSDLVGWTVPFKDQSLKTWHKAFEINLTSVFDLCQGLFPIMRKSVGANIINISSIYGLFGPDWKLYENTKMGNSAAYAASKSGLIGLTRWLSTALAPEIRVNAIAPGGIFRNQPDEFVRKYSLSTPLGRMATENDFRGAIQFLASDLSNYVTGQVLTVDGGFSVW
jgi:NAD(P)-dependent dehydrogenase (short-subunit alcohol dehydrogenase family)